MMNIRNICEQMIEVAKGAGELILHREDIRVKQKSDIANLVTSMDVKAQDYILKRLKVLMPNAKIIAEESDHNEFDQGYVWVVDPIDGTTNYAYDLKQSCISIALLYQGEGFIGIVYNPYLDETFVGVKGHGSYLNDTVIHVRDHDLKSSLVAIGTAPYVKEKADVTFNNLKKIFINARDLRRSGSATIDLCNVACGRYDAFYEASLAPWDYAAAAIIIEEAGGIIDALEPDKWGYEKTISVIAGNKNNFIHLKKLVK